MLPGSQTTPRGELTALVLEDSVVVLLDLQETLLALGVATVLGASSPCKALTIIGSSRADFAIVDYDIGDGKSLAVVDELLRLGIPVLLVTGCSSADDLPARHRNSPLLAKPFSTDNLEQALARLLATQ